MRYGWIGLACLALAACSKGPGSEAGETASSASDVAFSYRYDFRLPSARIADAQEAHAQGCERLGAARCRITGMSYRLDDSGQVSASLGMEVAASIARHFGREGVQAIERAGGALTGAEILGTDTRAQRLAAERQSAETRTDLAELDRQLAHADLPAGVRRDLIARRDGLVSQGRAATQSAADTQASVVATPISFTYRAGSGVGLSARLGEAGQAAYASLTWTLATTLTLLAYLGPPAVLLLLAALLWHHVGRRWWRRVFPPQA